jgi:hypothetical protein
MSEELSTLQPLPVTSANLASAARAVSGVPGGMVLDRSRGIGLSCGPQAWTVLLSRAVAADWAALAERPTTIAVAAHMDREAERLRVRFVIEVRPRGKGHEVVFRTSSGAVWAAGPAEVRPEGMDFAVPVRLPGGTAQGRIAGRLSAGGAITLTDGRIPAQPPRTAARPVAA